MADHYNLLSQPTIPGRVLQHNSFVQTNTTNFADQGRWGNAGTDSGGSFLYDGSQIADRLATGTASGARTATGTTNAGGVGARWPTNIGMLASFALSPSTSNFSFFSLRCGAITMGTTGPPSDCYNVRISNTAINLFESTSNTNSNIGGSSPSIATMTAGDQWWCRFECVGSLITVKVWKDGTPEPPRQDSTTGRMLSVYDSTHSNAGGVGACCVNQTTSSRSIYIHQITLYEPQTVPNSAIISRLTYDATVPIARTFAATVPTAASAKAADTIARHATVKLASASSSKATSTKEAKVFFAKAAAASNIPSITVRVGGTISFSAKVSETKNSKLRRVTAPTVSGLAGAFQSAAPTSFASRTTFRRAVRRTGKWSTSDSAKCTLTKSRILAAKSPIASKAKAVLSTTSTTGNPPAIPVNILNATPASNMIGTSGDFHVGSSLSPSGWTTYKSHAWAGFNAQIWVIGDKLSSPFGRNATTHNDPAGTQWALQRANEGWAEPNLNFSGTAAAAQAQPNNGLGQRNVWLSDNTFRGGWKIKWHEQVNWFDDVEAAAYQTVWGQLAASMVYLGYTHIYTDSEGFWTPTGHNPTSQTGAAVLAKIEQRGYETGKVIYTNNPNLKWNHYVTVPAGILWDRNYNPPLGKTTNYSDATMSFLLGIMRGGAEVGIGPGATISHLDNRIGYRGGFADSHNVKMAQTLDDACNASWQGMLHRLSSDLAPAVRDVWMGRVYWKAFSWGDCAGGVDFYSQNQQSPAVYNACQAVFRKWSGEGERMEYMYGGWPGSAPPSVSQFAGLANTYDAVPGRTANYQQMALTTTQDSTPITIGTVNQSRSGNTVTLTFTASHPYGIRNAHWKFFASNGTSVLSQGEAAVAWSLINTAPLPALTTANSFTTCTITIPNATTQLYATVDVFTVVGQRHSFRVQMDGGVVQGGASTGTYQVSAVGHATNPQATVACELTGTVSNNGNTNIHNPSIGFYDVATGNLVAFGSTTSQDNITLAPGQNMNFSTVTSHAVQAYVPAAAGNVTIRAKPGIDGVDQSTGTLDQTFTVAAAPPPPPPGSNYFVSSSSWNTPIPAGATYTDAAALHGTGWIETHTYGVPVVHAASTDPLTTISSDGNWQSGGWGWPETSVVVHCPSSMTGASGTDGSIAIIEPTAQNGYPAMEEYDFWQFRRTGPTTATAASYAHTNTVTGTGWSLDGTHGAGIHAAGSSLTAGLIIGSELRTGINHTLAIAMRLDLVQPWPNYVFPAISADGQGGPMKEGMRVGIPPNVAMPGGLTIQEQTLWTACKTYGCFIIDVNGGNAAVQFWGDGLSVPDSDVSPGLINPTTFATPGMTAICAALRIVT